VRHNKPRYRANQKRRKVVADFMHALRVEHDVLNRDLVKRDIESIDILSDSFIMQDNNLYPAMLGGPVNFTCEQMTNVLYCVNGKDVALIRSPSSIGPIKTSSMVVFNQTYSMQGTLISLAIYPNSKVCTGSIVLEGGGKQTCSSDCCHYSTDAWKSSVVSPVGEVMQISGKIVFQERSSSFKDYNMFGSPELCTAVNFEEKFGCFKNNWPIDFWTLFLFPVGSLALIMIAWILFCFFKKPYKIPGVRAVRSGVNTAARSLINYGTGTPYMNKRGKMRNTYIYE